MTAAERLPKNKRHRFWPWFVLLICALIFVGLVAAITWISVDYNRSKEASFAYNKARDKICMYTSGKKREDEEKKFCAAPEVSLRDVVDRYFTE